MARTLHPWQLLSVLVTGSLNDQQRRVIDYLEEENRVLRGQLGDKRIRLINGQRRRLAALGKALGQGTLRSLLDRHARHDPALAPSVHRRQVRRRWGTQAGATAGHGGGPAVGHPVSASENRSWGYERIEGELRKLGHRVARTTIANILSEQWSRASPAEGAAHHLGRVPEDPLGFDCGDGLLHRRGADREGLTRFHVLFVIDLPTWRVKIVGVNRQPHGAWVINALRGLLDDFDGLLAGHTHLIHDRDPLFKKAMVDTLSARGVASVKLPPRSLNLNAYAERFVRSIKGGCLDRVIPIGERHLRRAIDAYVEHYNRDRPHQGVGNVVLTPSTEAPVPGRRVVCDEKLGGLIRSYRWAA